MKKILIILSIVVSLFASVESEVEKSRFSHKNGVLTDSFAGMQWQDNKDSRSIRKKWKDAISYCENLTLDDKSDWRLVNKIELEYVLKNKQNFKNISDNFYWSSTTFSDNTSEAWDGALKGAYISKSAKSYIEQVRCVRGEQFDNFDSLKRKVKKYLNLKYQNIKNNIKKQYEKVNSQNNISGYEWFIKT